MYSDTAHNIKFNNQPLCLLKFPESSSDHMSSLPLPERRRPPEMEFLSRRLRKLFGLVMLVRTQSCLGSGGVRFLHLPFPFTTWGLVQMLGCGGRAESVSSEVKLLPNTPDNKM